MGKKKNRPGGIKPDALIQPIEDQMATLKSQRDKSMLEDFLANKSQLLLYGAMDFDKFEKIKLIADGLGDGRSVHLVKHKESGMILVQKIIHRDPNPDVARMIKGEVEIMHSCVHPKVVQFYGGFLSESHREVNIVMEYMNGGCLDAVIRRIGRIEEPELRAITKDVCEGLHFLMKQMKVLHRDIKPSNILINTNGEVKLCDFGVSRHISGTKQKMKTFVGTVRYMAPERLTGSEYTAASDIWALGFSLIELATGNYPLQVDSSQERPAMVAKRNPRDPDWTGPNKEDAFKGIPVITFIELICEAQDIGLPEPEVNGFSPQFDNFVKSCTSTAPEQRPELTSVMDHPWLTNKESLEKVNLAEFAKLSLSASGVEEALMYAKKQNCPIDLLPTISSESGLSSEKSVLPSPSLQEIMDDPARKIDFTSQEQFLDERLNADSEDDDVEEEEVDLFVSRVTQQQPSIHHQQVDEQQSDGEASTKQQQPSRRISEL